MSERSGDLERRVAALEEKIQELLLGRDDTAVLRGAQQIKRAASKARHDRGPLPLFGCVCGRCSAAATRRDREAHPNEPASKGTPR